MDTNLNTTETPFGVEITKTLALSAAAAAGTVIGFVVIGYVAGKVTTVIEKRNAKKALKKEEVFAS